ncbi:iron-sulfur cluster assembly scaffold protein [Rhizosaccharibacter radicis]|uniref:Iron-sulfur cluster assembly scaffold protein n=1 Tax=Rhizosaccharibacter radicis TaxID=2782605 RepID=A0ABT1W0L1_9PROT|nr:iron-sulfur cluster assembly scaffold protein [Acetobacteraceae bacterium KSS12]
MASSPDTVLSEANAVPDGASLYRELVMTRARRPERAGALDDADGEGSGTNPLCGDTVQVWLRRGPDGLVQDARHRTRGCAICAAAADLVADAVVGKDAGAFALLERRFGTMLQDGPEALSMGDRGAIGFLLALGDLHEYPSRRKCALLPFSAVRQALVHRPGEPDGGAG